MVLVVEVPAMGPMLCPEHGCASGSTWRATTVPSTAQEIAETSQLGRETLEAAGVPVPGLLR